MSTEPYSHVAAQSVSAAPSALPPGAEAADGNPVSGCEPARDEVPPREASSQRDGHRQEGKEGTVPAVLLDSCAAICLMSGEELSLVNREAINRARAGNQGVYVSPITAWEVAGLVAANRLRLTIAADAWFDRLLALPGIRLAALPPRVLVAAAGSGGAKRREPAGAIVAATACEFGYVLISRDSLCPGGEHRRCRLLNGKSCPGTVAVQRREARPAGRSSPGRVR
jgi:PIN domain nuclease of toxin-antitoxin system